MREKVVPAGARFGNFSLESYEVEAIRARKHTLRHVHRERGNEAEKLIEPVVVGLGQLK